ncbi:response regulator receiver modulated diguanylate cyclase [Sulfurimonas gotlandica GD1]|uniref:diguanylate cyclase n=1 Tax=Sulfurimonas gotlandica (strain DSM 19862 / JCM 16533 / GD1) TaxID=929558 RepID=B6BLW0_SULGG|nr:response regulator [Sulfurimonas gotlandica]EDZ61795.1 response regulator PleD [Sulfurimonas gotlandica GD1]EHP29468.1 response regulator receiver modulated diguanylate cyclase [Sulfurimonas gotlandica GD1]
MKKVLVVDDSQTVLSMLKSEIEKYSDIKPYFASSYKEAMRLLREHQGKFHAALLDLNLPDAPEGEVVALANSHNIPSVVLTGTIDEKAQLSLLKKDVIDVILKNDPSSIKFAVKEISRTLKNYDTTVLVVDDSKLFRQILRECLEKIKLNVIEATNGQEALDLLNNKENKISLILTDYEMPIVNGLDLTFKIREKYKKDQLGIIVISSAEAQNVISKFLKFGANDFINKPFTENEIITRVNSNLELLDLFDKIRDMANKDFLTGAYNRRYFFDSGNSTYSKNKRNDTPLAVAMIDIDKFKNINDTYGHDIGDIAIKEVKKILDENLRTSDLMARFGGEEFCILLEDISLENIKVLFEKIRKKFEDNVIDINATAISYTISTGIYFGFSDSLEDMIRLSDEALYTAKESGRNRVEIKQ